MLGVEISRDSALLSGMDGLRVELLLFGPITENCVISDPVHL
jgi:hypothetical protein